MLDVLYEDNHIIVVLKPQNIPTQEDSSKDMDMLNIVKGYIKEKYNKPGNVYVGLVHRLDRPTGGVMVFAKTSKAAARLSESIKDGSFEKTYLAVTSPAPKEKQARIENYLLKDEKNNIVSIVPMSQEGAKRAELTYTVVENNNNNALCEVNLLTGRSHQIRVQMASIGAPLYGDNKYKGVKGAFLALWAYKLTFIHPVSKDKMSFVCYPPEVLPWTKFNIEKFIERGI